MEILGHATSRPHRTIEVEFLTEQNETFVMNCRFNPRKALTALSESGLLNGASVTPCLSLRNECSHIVLKLGVESSERYLTN